MVSFLSGQQEEGFVDKLFGAEAESLFVYPAAVVVVDGAGVFGDMNFPGMLVFGAEVFFGVDINPVDRSPAVYVFRAVFFQHFGSVGNYCGQVGHSVFVDKR